MWRREWSRSLRALIGLVSEANNVTYEGNDGGGNSDDDDDDDLKTTLLFIIV